MALNYTITHNGSTWSSSSSVSSISLSNGSTTSSITSAGTRTLNCAGKMPSNNIVIGAKTLACAGKIMSGNVVITSTTVWDPTAHSRVGGRIFYINTSSSNSYTIYDSSGNVISTYTVDGLANAYYYDKNGSSVDKFYVFNSSRISNRYWGYHGDSVVGTADSIGRGKTNTQTVLSTGVPTDYTPNIWQYISDCQNNSLNGCADWYISGLSELKQLYSVASSVGVQSWFTSSSSVWTSIEYGSKHNPETFAFAWRASTYSFTCLMKCYTANCFAARSF